MWGCIYLLNNEIGEAYIGSSIDWEKRLSAHRIKKTINMDCLWYWDFLEEGEYTSVEELRKKEQEYIRDNKDCINKTKYKGRKQINKDSYLNHKEERTQQKRDYYLNHKEAIIAKNKIWGENNKEKKLQDIQNWGHNNREKVLEYKKKWARANKDKQTEYNKQYREKQKNKINL